MHDSQLTCRRHSFYCGVLLAIGLVGCCAAAFCLTLGLFGVSDRTGFTQLLVLIALSGAAAAARCYQRLRSEYRRFAKGRGLLASHIDRVRLAARGKSVNPSQQAELESLRRGLAGSAAWTAFVAAKLPSGGIIGTMIGVLSVTDGFGRTIGSLQEGEGKVALVGMADAMGGLSTAFTSSLVALSLSAWLASLLLCLRGMGDGLLRGIESHTARHVLPHLRLPEIELTAQIAAPLHELVAIDRSSCTVLHQVLEGVTATKLAIETLANSRNSLSLTPEASVAVREACRVVTTATHSQDDIACLLKDLRELLAEPDLRSRRAEQGVNRSVAVEAAAPRQAQAI